ncbi:MAG: hypothetical protein ACREBH_04565 [Candidatus Micrarchaeaceae archaeon]
MVNVGFDLDGTLANSWEAVLAIIGRRHGLFGSKHDIKRYEVNQNPMFRSLTHKQVGEAFLEAWRNHGSIRLEDSRIPGIVRGLRGKYDGLYVVTAAYADTSEIRRWLRAKDVAVDGILHYGSARDKLRADVDVHVDDFHEIASLGAAMGRTVILLSQPWNADFRNVRMHTNIKIAKDWGEVGSILHSEYERIKAGASTARGLVRENGPVHSRSRA